MAILSQRLMADVVSGFYKESGIRIGFVDISGRMAGAQDSPLAVYTKGKRNYALQESVNRGEPFFINCGAGLVCWVAALEDRRRVHGGIVGGPVILDQEGEAAAERQLQAALDRPLAAVRRMVNKLQRSTRDAAVENALSCQKMFYAISGWKPVLMQENSLKVRQQAQLAQSIADKRRDGVDSPLYAFEKERALLANIRAGARNEARSILNGMLSNIYLATTQIVVLRARTVELMSYLTRAAVEDNMLLEQLIRMNHVWTERLTTAGSFEELSERLMAALDEFIDTVYVQGLNRSRSVGTAMDYIRLHYTENISLREVAEHVGLSPWRTAHLVKDHTGRTVLENILDLRIRRAQQLLAGTDMKCTDICFQVGFNDQSYFNKQFKKLTGVTPVRYRKG